MTGVLWSGTGIGMLIVSPAANWLIYTRSWQTSYLILGGIILVVVILAAQFLRRDPSRAGQLPYGEYQTDGHKQTDASAFTLQEATHTRQFWLLIIMFICFGFCVFAVTVHVVPSAIERDISAASSANILAILGGVRILGGLALGNIADRIGNRRALIIGLVLMAVALFWLVPASEFWAFSLFAVVFALGYGGTSAAQSPLVAQLFGLKSHGVLYGFCGLSYTIGGALGPFITGYLFDVTQSYPLAFLVSAVVGIIGILSIAIIKPLKKVP